VNTFAGVDIKSEDAAYVDMPYRSAAQYANDLTNDSLVIENVLGTASVLTHASPQASSSPEAYGYLFGAGMLGSRGGTGFNNLAEHMTFLQHLLIGNVPTYPLLNLTLSGPDNEAASETYADHVAAVSSMWPMIYSVYAHSRDDISLNNMTWMAKRLKNDGAPVMAWAKALPAINAASNRSTDHTWTVQMATPPSSYATMLGSPLRGAASTAVLGVASLTSANGVKITDGSSNLVVIPDIGAYQSQPTSSMGMGL
jgi:hypothetical protein